MNAFVRQDSLKSIIFVFNQADAGPTVMTMDSDSACVILDSTDSTELVSLVLHALLPAPEMPKEFAFAMPVSPCTAIIVPDVLSELFSIMPPRSVFSFADKTLPMTQLNKDVFV